MWSEVDGMIRRRIVRAVYAIIVAVSAAALSGWFVDRGQASGENGWKQPAWLLSAPAASGRADAGQADTWDTYAVRNERTSLSSAEKKTAEAGRQQDGGAVSVGGGEGVPDERKEKPVIVVAGAPGTVPGDEGANKTAATAATAAQAPVRKTVYLTFDDGPSKLTTQVLDILKQEGIQATFFVLGEQVKGHPELLRRIVAEGHTVGNHSYDHEYKKLYAGFGAFADQIVRTEEAMQAAAGVRTRLVRAPGGTFGNFDQSYFDAMEQAGYTMFDWNVDSGDSVRVGVPASEIKQNVRNSKLYDETIVLLHDSASHAESIKALPDIIQYYKKQGYTFAPLTESVKPVTFRLADKLKWSRPKATEKERAEVRRGLAAGDAPFVLSGQAAASSAGEEPKKELVVTGESSTVIFEPNAYAIVGDDWRVPLRELVEGLGGAVRWDAVQRQAIAMMPSGTRFVISDGDGTGSINRQGKVYALLRDTLLRIDGEPVEPVSDGGRIVFAATAR